MKTDQDYAYYLPHVLGDKMRSVITGFSLLLSVGTLAASELPASQNNFLQIAQTAAQDYSSQIASANQIRIDQLRDKRASELCALLNPDDVFGWKGIIQEVTQLNGKIGLTVTIGEGVQLSVSTEDSDAISSASFLAQTLVKLSEGDAVAVSGGFEERGRDCFTHKSVDEADVFKTPTFAFRFDFIEPIVEIGGVADAQRPSPRRPAAIASTPPKLECRFTISRIAIPEGNRAIIGTGTVEVAERKLTRFEGRWLTKDGAEAFDFSALELSLDDKAMLVGDVMLPMLFPTKTDSSPPETYAVIRPQDSLAPMMPNGSVEFPVDGFFRGAIALDGCGEI